MSGGEQGPHGIGEFVASGHPHSRRAAETVVELPADPLSGNKPYGRGSAWPRRYGEEGLDPGKDSQPTVAHSELDVDLAQDFLAVARVEAVALMHTDHVRDPGRHRRVRKPTGAAFLRAAASPLRDCFVQDVRIH
jgi:hypothetical protein